MTRINHSVAGGLVPRHFFARNSRISKRRVLLKYCVFFCHVCFFILGHVEEVTSAQHEVQTLTHPDWGLAVGFRSASIIYESEDNLVSTFIPLLYYDGDYFYLDGIEGGLHLYRKDNWQFDLLASLRFYDIDESSQKNFQGELADLGGKIRYSFDSGTSAQLELLTDQFGNTQTIFEADHRLANKRFSVTPFANIRYKDSDFNSRYYGQGWRENVSIEGGFDFQAGLRARYHVFSNLYLLGAADVRLLDRAVSESPGVEQGWEASVFGGIGIFNEEASPDQADISITPYLRISHAWATYSSIGETFSGSIEYDEENNQMSSFFWGYPLSDKLFSLPIHMYITSGVAHHYASNVQSSAVELVLALKAYYTFDLPVRLRLGFAEGISYITDVTYVERIENEARNEIPSKVLNYLDFSLDISIGDLLRSDKLKDVWFGAAIHHRSAVFEYSQHFGRTHGGSNYPSLYLQYHF